MNNMCAMCAMDITDKKSILEHKKMFPDVENIQEHYSKLNKYNMYLDAKYYRYAAIVLMASAKKYHQSGNVSIPKDKWKYLENKIFSSACPKSELGRLFLFSNDLMLKTIDDNISGQEIVETFNKKKEIVICLTNEKLRGGESPFVSQEELDRVLELTSDIKFLIDNDLFSEYDGDDDFERWN